MMDPTTIKIKYTQLFINNEFVDAVNKTTFPVLNPANEEKIADVSAADKVDVDIAVEAAKAAFARDSPWRTIDASERGRTINRLADYIQRDINELAALESLNNGKTYQTAILDIQMAIDVFRYYAGYCDKIHGNTMPIDGPYFGLTRKEPVGVVAQIIPWNYPILMLSWKWAPALAAGCTIILKPAEQTPLTALALGALAKEAGFPPGVVNILTGYGHITGEALCLHNEVQKVAFTGSTEIGHKIMQYAGQSNLKRISLELGGKSPLVVFDDADLEEAVEIAHNAIFANHGQNCCAGSRTFVQSKIYDEFVKKSTERAAKIKVGDPFQADVDQGAQIDDASLKKVLRFVDSGVKEGAKLETGGHRVGTKGYFVEPTVFSNVTDDMEIAKLEIFGPVQSILKFETLEEVIERANKTEFGLAAGVVTKNLQNALAFAQAVEAGSVWVNCYDVAVAQTPFGGYKKSGFGKDLGEDAINDYVNVKTIAIKM